MQIYRFAEDGTETLRRITGRVQQYSDNVETVYVVVNGINPSNYVASLVCTPNGATESVTLAMDPTSFQIDGITYQGFKKTLPGAVTAVAGPLAINIYVEDSSTTLVTATSSVYVNASGGVEWDEPINYSQWKELIANILSLKGQFLGEASSLSFLDDYKTTASSGFYWFFYQGGLWALSVVGDGTAAKQTALVFASNQALYRQARVYSSSAWSSWASEVLASQSYVDDLRDELSDGSLIVARAAGDENGNDIFDTYLSKLAASSTYETLTGSAGKLSEAKTYADGVGTAITNTKGQANGICQLDPNAKVPLSKIPDSILGSLFYGGTFLPATGIATVNDDFKAKFSYSQNTLTITSDNSSTYKNVYFLAQDSATFLSMDFDTGDWIVSNGSAGWGKVDNVDAVKLVNGQIGIVVLGKYEVGLGNVDNTSDANKPISTAQATVNSTTLKKTTILTTTLNTALTTLGNEFGIDGIYGSYFCVIFKTGTAASGRFISTQSSVTRSFKGLALTTTLADAYGVSVVDAERLITGSDFTALVASPSIYNMGYFTIVDSSSTTYALGSTYLLTAGGIVTKLYSADTNAPTATTLIHPLNLLSNVIDSTNYFSGYYHPSNGTVEQTSSATSDDRCYRDYISVTSGATVTIIIPFDSITATASVLRIYAYDSSKVFIGTYATLTRYLDKYYLSYLPSGASFIRVCLPAAAINSSIIAEGDLTSTYEKISANVPCKDFALSPGVNLYSTDINSCSNKLSASKAEFLSSLGVVNLFNAATATATASTYYYAAGLRWDPHAFTKAYEDKIFVNGVTSVTLAFKAPSMQYSSGVFPCYGIVVYNTANAVVGSGTSVNNNYTALHNGWFYYHLTFSSGIGWVAFWLPDNVDSNTIMLYKGTDEFNHYVTYGKTTYPNSIRLENDIDLSEISGNVPIDHTETISITRPNINILPYNSEDMYAVPGKWHTANGTVWQEQTGPNSCFFDYIPVDSGNMSATLSVPANVGGTGVATIYAYDVNKSYITYATNSGLSISGRSYVTVTSTSSEIRYVRISFPTAITSDYSGIMVSVGSSTPPLSPAVKYSLNSRIDMSSFVSSQNLADLRTSITPSLPLGKGISPCVGNVMCVGDSLTVGMYYEEQYAVGIQLTHNYPYWLRRFSINDGANNGTGWSTSIYADAGYTTIQIWNKYFSASATNPISWSTIPDVICVWLGANGGLTDTIDADTSAASYENYADTNTGRYCSIIESIKSHCPNSVIVLLHCGHNQFTSPSVVTSINAIMDKIAQKYSLPTVRVYEDMSVDNVNYKTWQGDGLHFNGFGYNQVASLTYNVILSYLFNNPGKIKTLPWYTSFLQQ